MLTQLQVRNFEASFDMLDNNRDGTIDGMDLADFARSVCDALGVAADSPERAAIINIYSSLWETIRRAAEADDDGRVSRAEYMAAAGTLIHDDDYIDACGRLSDAYFDVVDIDDDGFLSPDEVIPLHQSMGMDASTSAAAFAQVDTDDDGRVSRDEWRAAVVGIYLNDSPEGIGSNMLGNAK